MLAVGWILDSGHWMLAVRFCAIRVRHVLAVGLLILAIDWMLAVGFSLRNRGSHDGYY